ncbi:MAG: hypothetical protein [Wendovervirus sonii]|uniref:RNA ligase domain-containing protein n=1 Tax=phage Lak_Megaphage_Sonny TaxID=3109229 RepID=A0ABZ0Z2A6_9CAUD|nr:MAG: hypothetical protein [phage Lak_Megaphage_Sonny]
MTCNYIKYPRTFHLPYSLTISDDDKRLESDEQFKQMKEVVVTIKMDGENTTVYPNGYIHARSLDGNKNPWQNIVKRLIQNWFYMIPDGWRVCGENLQAKHSIGYTFKSINDVFQVFGIYDENNNCIAWDNVKNFCDECGIKTVPEIYRGPYDKEKILKAFQDYSKIVYPQEVEGFVIRNAESFPYEEFKNNTGKYVRANHVQTDTHWTQNWTNNQFLKNE